METIRLNVGCGVGGDMLPDWINVDSVDGNGVDAVADCCSLPYADNSADAIRCSHLIEHLTKPELDAFAAECYRVLRPGGTLEVIAPAMDMIIATYWECRDQESIAVEDFPIGPLDWLDNLLFSRHLHATDFHKQGIYPAKLLRVFRRFSLHQFEHQSRPHSRWEIRWACTKPHRLFCSVVLSTRDKARELDLTLSSIFAQDVPFPFEVIVVDDGSTDGTAEVCRKHGVQYHHLENPRYRNPSVARNVGYRAARGEIIIAQSDDIIHVSPNAIEFLASNLKRGEALLAKVDNYEYTDGRPSKFIMTYCGPTARRPYFFLGAVWRADLYAVGGCDEEFVEPCFDDNWFADCLIDGLHLKIRYTDEVQGHHQRHEHGETTHAKEHVSRDLYHRKVAEAKKTGVYISSGGRWPMEEKTETRVKAVATLPQKKAIVCGDKIPRTMHFFWAADRMSWMRWMSLYSFRYHNPDWRIILHCAVPDGGKQWKTAETQDQETYRGPDYSSQIEVAGVELVRWSPPVDGLAPAHASDLCQWELLSTEGGWYADMDFLFVAPMPANQVADADAVFCLSLGFMAIGLFGASPDSRLFRDVLASARDGYKPGAYQSTGAEAVYRLGGVWPDWPAVNQPGDKALAALRKKYRDLNVVELPSRAAYPWPYTEVQKIFAETNETPEGCVGVHWFGGNSLAQDWNRRLTHENFREYHNTYTAEVARIRSL